ncbi:MAG: hypothetical protein ACI81T_002230 [Bacteroidia bacterium]|jgi:hypothetical protein
MTREKARTKTKRLSDNLCDSRCCVRHATRKTIFDWLEIRFFNLVISTPTKFVREPTKTREKGKRINRKREIMAKLSEKVRRTTEKETLMAKTKAV